MIGDFLDEKNTGPSSSLTWKKHLMECHMGK